MTPRSGSSFGFRIFLLNLSTVFLVGVALSGLFVREQYLDAVAALTRRGAVLTRSLASASEIGAFGGSKDALEGAMRGALADSDVQYAVVYDKNGEAIAFLTPDGSLTPPTDYELLPGNFFLSLKQSVGVTGDWSDLSSPARLATVSLTREPTDNYPVAGLDTWYPVLITQQDTPDDASLLVGGPASPGPAHRTLVGLVRVGMSRSSLYQAQERSVRLAVLTLAVALILATGASLALSRQLAAPIRRLAEGARALGAGQLSARVQVETRDEVGELAQAFNRMAANLQDVYQGLEEKVAERTGELSEEKNRLEAVLNTIDEGVVMLDASGHFALVNRKFLELTGLTREQVAGKSFRDVVEHFAQRVHDPKALRDRTAYLLRHPEERAVDMFELTAPERKILHRFSAPVLDDAHQRTLMGRIEVYRDITRETEIDRMKSEFISTVSHELRTPLTSIKGSLGLILGGAAGDLPDDVKELLNIAQNNSERLIRLINDILDISKIESGKMKLKLTEFDLREVARESFQGIDAFALKYEVKLRLDMAADFPLPVSADHDRILQVLTNLLSNAIKFSRKGGEVVLSLARENGQYLFKVKDAGIGIPADQIGKLFQKFQQVEGTYANQVGGSGLGLAICRALVQEHGGDVSVESVLGEGSTFTFWLPAPEITAGEAVAQAIAATGGDFEGMHRVMVVDDDRDVANLIRMYLEHEGFEVLVAAGGKQALEIARAEKLDAITMDLNMPGLSGFEVVKALKEDPATKDVPVIFVSVSSAEEATPNPSDVPGAAGTSAASLTFADWVTKPIDPLRLIAAVKRHAAKRAGKPSILVVDDDPDIQRVLGILLSREGFEVESAGNGEEALRRVAARRPDLLILDLVMPGLDGFAVVKRLREQRSTRRIPILILSVKDISEEERMILEAGATKFLTKSYANREALLREVVDLLNGALRSPDDRPTERTGDLKVIKQ